MENLEIDVLIESAQENIPSSTELTNWVKASLETNDAEITIRIVDETESEKLNTQYRHKPGPTNVLAFPSISQVDDTLLGDIVICAPLVFKEAREQNKTARDHFAHLTVHGTLHLQGYDHISDEDAKLMEQQEITILESLGIANPYD